MKLYHLLTIAVFFCLEINGQESGNAVAYMKTINDEYQDIQKKMWDYTSTMAHSQSARKVDSKRLSLLKTIDDSKKTVQGMSAFNGDYSLRDSVISYLTLTFMVLNNDFAQIIDMEEVAEQSYDLMEAYLLAQEKANDKLDEASERMDIQYSDFASKHGVTLVENRDEISRKLKIASGALEYYNQVFLIFFKAYKQELYLLDALEKMDINAMEQNRNSLAAIADEGLKKLSGLGSYKGDNSLIAACSRLLSFYKDEAENKIIILSDFYLAKDDYDKKSALFESKDRMLLTADEVQQYNTAVNNYNKSVTKFNATNNSLNEKRKVNLDNWNNAVTSFMSRQIPQK